MKSTPKTKSIITAALALMISWMSYSCKKSERADPIDKTEFVSSNVAQYMFGPQNLATSFTLLSIKTTKDTAENSAWFVYLYHQPLNRWYTLPGYGNGGATNYRFSYDFKEPGNFTIYIDKVGPGENYAKAKVIRVYSKNRNEIARLKNDPEIAVKLLEQ